MIYFVILPPPPLLVVFAEGLVAFVAVVLLPLLELSVLLLVAFCAYPWDGMWANVAPMIIATTARDVVIVNFILLLIIFKVDCG